MIDSCLFKVIGLLFYIKIENILKKKIYKAQYHMSH